MTDWLTEAQAACADYNHDHLITVQEAKRTYLKRALAIIRAADELATLLKDRVNFPEDAEVHEALAAYRKARHE